MMAAYAVINENGIVVNAIEWDGQEEWNPPEGCTVVACGDSSCQIGGTLKDGVFSPPPPVELTKDELIAQADANKSSLMAEINTYTQPWQTQLMLGIITDADKASLTTWMKYYQQVQAVYTSTAPDITWPDKPE